MNNAEDHFWENFESNNLSSVPDANNAPHHSMERLFRVQLERVMTFQNKVEKIARSLSELGSIVEDINAGNTTKRALFWIKHLHSNAHRTQDFLSHPTYAQTFFRHQNSILELQQKIVDGVGDSKVRFFLEGWGATNETHHYTTENLSRFNDWPEEVMQEARHDRNTAFKLFMVLERLYKNNPLAASGAFQHFVGVNRFIKRLLASGRCDPSRVCGLFFNHIEEQRVAAKQEGKAYDLVTSSNKPIIEHVANNLNEGEIGIGILGGGHFSSGYWSANEKMEESFQSIESLAKQSVNLRDTRMMIVEPHDYPLATNEFEQSMYIQFHKNAK